MAVYVYRCAECEIEIEERRPMNLADDPMWCPACGQECKRAIGVGINFYRSGESSYGKVPDNYPRHNAGCPCCAPMSRTVQISSE